MPSLYTVLLTLLTIIFPAKADFSLNHTQTQASTLAPLINTETPNCVQCHAEQVILWQNSHHAKSLQHANQETVLGNFNQFLYQNNNSWTLFGRDEQGYFIKTGQNEAEGQRYAVAFVLGFYPLQQILIDIGKGRLQAYTLAWDARPLKEGGQRWYPLYDDSHQQNSPFYWKGQFNNWNTRCAQCHSSALNRNYNLDTDSYHTQWTQPNVSCQACHGHVHQTETQSHLTQIKSKNRQNTAQTKLKYTLPEKSHFIFSPEQSTAKSVSQVKPQNSSNSIIETQQTRQCILCHSRRHTLTEGHGTGNIHQEIIPRLAIPPLYYEDGQINDEVFVYGSYSQSKMSAAGVVCSHCHDPHSGQTLLKNNKLCHQCHQPSSFDTPKHTLHSNNVSNSPLCVDCHMPQTIYMGIDARRDHSFRIPNPWVSEHFNSPNACLNCHKNKDNAWAKTILAHKKKRIIEQNNDIGTIKYLTQIQPALAKTKLTQTLLDSTAPVMRRATLTALLDTSNTQDINTLNTLANEAPALIKLGVINKLQSASFSVKLQIGFSLLYDEHKSVRLSAIKLLAPAFKTQLPEKAEQKLISVLKEAINTYSKQQDLLSGQLTLADLAYGIGDLKQASIHYQNAIRLQPQFLPAKLNLASIYRETEQYLQAKILLKDILSIDNMHTLAHYNLGLIFVLEKNWPLALSALAQATQNEPDNIQFIFVYLLALEASGQIQAAKAQLNKLIHLTPKDPVLKQIKNRLYQAY